MLTLKFFLNMSKKEQLGRLLARIDDPEKRWKFAAHDVEERKLWDEYMQAYQADDQQHRDQGCAMVRGAGRPRNGSRGWWSPRRWCERLEALDLKFPKLDDATMAQLETIRAELVAQKPKNNKG